MLFRSQGPSEFFFDSETHLLAGSNSRVVDNVTRAVRASEIRYSNYAAVNGGDGLRILAATTPIFDSNTAVSNGGVGIRLASAGSQVESNRSEKNGDFEYVIAAGNTDLGNDRANGSTFAFPPAGGSYE